MIEKVSLKNMTTNAEVTLDMDNSVYLLESADLGTIDASHHSYKFVNQIGTHVTKSTLNERDIEIVGWVVGDTEEILTAKRKVLNKMINPQQVMRITVKDNYVIDALPKTTVRYSPGYAENNEVMCKFKISAVCPDPLFATKQENKVLAANIKPCFKFPVTIPRTKGIIMGLKQPSLIVNVVNRGTVETGMRIVFKANGTVTNPSLMNVNTQEFIKINKTMQAGEEIVVNTIIGQKGIKGKIANTESNYFRYRDLDSTWLQLDLGDNLFRYDAQTNLSALEVYIYYKDKYLEVE